jgi:hypothetical protein
MQVGHNLREIFRTHVLGPSPGVETDIQPEIDCIGPVLDRRPDALPVAGRGQKLGNSPAEMNGRIGRRRHVARTDKTGGRDQFNGSGDRSPAGRINQSSRDRAESAGFVRTAFNGVWSNGITLCKGIVDCPFAAVSSVLGQDAARR